MDDRHGVGRLKRKRPLGILRRRWENNIKMYLQEVGSRDMNCIHLAMDMDRQQATIGFHKMRGFP
jgi:hypothetical protein